MPGEALAGGFGLDIVCAVVDGQMQGGGGVAAVGVGE